MECLQASRNFHQDDENKLIDKTGESKCLKLIISTFLQTPTKLRKVKKRKAPTQLKFSNEGEK